MELVLLTPTASYVSAPKLTKFFSAMFARHPRYSLVWILLFLSSSLAWGRPVQADVPAGTVIDNRATGSFDDPFAPANTSVSVESNLVTVTVAEVAGITATGSGSPQEAPSGVTGAGSWQGNGSFNTGDVVYFDFLVTNTGNDPTQFFIPGQVGIIGGTLQGNVQIIQLDPDGGGPNVPLATPTTASPINVPVGGATTATLLTTAVSPTGLPNGSLPIGGTVQVRVPVKITANPGVGTVKVTLGDTGSNDNSANTQNQPLTVSSGRDLYTQDNPDTFGAPEVAGAPINGSREASATQSIDVAAAISGRVWEDANNSITIDTIGNGSTLESGTNTGSTALTIYTIDVNDKVVAKSPVATNGLYSLSLPTGNNYRLRVINNAGIAIGATAPSPNLPSGYSNTGENFGNVPETASPGEIAIINLANNLTDYNFGIQRNGYCSIGSGTADLSTQPYISTEAGNASTAAATVNNLRSYSDGLDDSWRIAAGGLANGTATPWFPNGGSNTNSFIYKEPGSSTAITTTVTPLRVPLDSTMACAGGSTNISSSTVSFGDNLQDGSPRPASLFSTANPAQHPGYWSTTGTAGTNRSAVKFTFSQPVKSFGAWFGDLETRTQSGMPAYLRLIDSSGNRIGKDIPIEPQTLYDGISPGSNPIISTINQSNCGGSSSGFVGCGNRSTRWVGFIDNVSVPRVKEVLVIVGDNNQDPSSSILTQQLSFIGANYQSIPNLILVKRITRVNGTTTTSDGVSTLGYIDEPINPYDDNNIASPAVTPPDTNLWPTDNTGNPLLVGAINGGRIRPGNEVEYTIYFLSYGDDAAKNVVLCDRVPSKQIFSPYAFNATGTTGIGRGIQVSLNGTINNYTNNQDGDIGTFYPPGTTLPVACGTAANTQGAVVVKLGNITSAKINPNGAYGYVRFRARVE
jgi:uncharacterized repeat protein (TIGR01451 family)